MQGIHEQHRNDAMTDTTARDDAGVEPEGSPAAEPAERTVEDVVDALVKESAEHKDRWLRTLAEMENMRRRTEREVADARAYGITNFARDIVGVADNMQRALQALDDELREKADAGVKALLDGLELTERELLKVLEKHGVQKIEPAGQKFDPNFHQAMFEVPDETVPSGTVAQVVQPGYIIADRVLRPALVAVSKGGPKAAADAAANDNADAGPPPQG
jgi:molecular chaperone GrpE